MTVRRHLALAAAALFCLAGAASADPVNAVTGQKLDSGLGELPHYSKWADPRGGRAVAATVAGESIDNGLGELPHFRTWADPSGKNPLRADAARPAKVQVQLQASL